jgi:hypothetical protein
MALAERIQPRGEIARHPKRFVHDRRAQQHRFGAAVGREQRRGSLQMMLPVGQLFGCGVMDCSFYLVS